METFLPAFPLFGSLSASVPGALGAIGQRHAFAGGLPWADLAAPAIRLARDGFAATRRFCALAVETEGRLRADPRSTAAFLGKQPSDLIVQPEIGLTLEARLLLGSGVLGNSSRNQAGDELAERGFSTSARVVHEREEAEVKRQLVLRDAAMQAQLGVQQ